MYLLGSSQQTTEGSDSDKPISQVVEADTRTQPHRPGFAVWPHRSGVVPPTYQLYRL